MKQSKTKRDATEWLLEVDAIMQAWSALTQLTTYTRAALYQASAIAAAAAAAAATDDHESDDDYDAQPTMSVVSLTSQQQFSYDMICI